jgi:hypothetical protein
VSGDGTRRRLLAAGVAVAGLLMLAAVGSIGYGMSAAGSAVSSAATSVEDVVGSSSPSDTPGSGIWSRHTPVQAVNFYGGYFCASGSGGHVVRHVLTLQELDMLAQGRETVAGPFSSTDEAARECRG